MKAIAKVIVISFIGLLCFIGNPVTAYADELSYHLNTNEPTNGLVLVTFEYPWRDMNTNQWFEVNGHRYNSDAVRICDFVAADNGSYHCKLYDMDDNLWAEGDIVISNIDKEPPSISVFKQENIFRTADSAIVFKAFDPSTTAYPNPSSDSQDDFEWSYDGTNYFKQTTAYVTEYLTTNANNLYGTSEVDAGLLLPADPPAWGSSDGAVVMQFDDNFESGVRTIYCRDAAGNVASFNTFSVSKIDKWGPIFVSSSKLYPTGYQVVTNANGTFTNAPYITLSSVATDYIKYKNALGVEQDTEINGSGLASARVTSYSINTQPTDIVTSTTSSNITIYNNAVFGYKLVDAAGNDSTEINATISCFDREAPSATVTAQRINNQGTILVSHFNDNGGAGLHDTSYSYDGGRTWVSTDRHVVTKNGDFKVLVRDALGNYDPDGFTVSVSCVDVTPPVVNIKSSDWGQKVTITVDASDADSGLSDKPISFDGGKTWTNDTQLSVDKNAQYNIWVRDNFNNITKVNHDVTKVDSTAPTLTFTYDKALTNKSVEITCTVKDDGSGIPDDCLSFDSGRSFQKNMKYTVDTNQKFQIVAKDKVGNLTVADVDITNIDKQLPELKDVKQTPEGTNLDKVTLTLTIEDVGVAGLDPNPVSWDEGKTWVTVLSKDFTENTRLKILIRDKIGNIQTVEYLLNALKTTYDNSTSSKPVDNSVTDLVSTTTSTRQEPDVVMTVTDNENTYEVNVTNLIENVVKRYSTVPTYVGRYKTVVVVGDDKQVYEAETGDVLPGVTKDDVEDIVEIDPELTEDYVDQTEPVIQQDQSIDTSSKPKKNNTILIIVVASVGVIGIVGGSLAFLLRKPKGE